MITAFITEVVEKLSMDAYHSYLALLPESDQLKIRRFVHWRDAHLSLFGRLLLIEGLTQRGYSTGKIKHLDQTFYSRPFFKDGPNFNISHSGRFVVCILADDKNKIGVDVEEIRPIGIEDFRSQWTEVEWKCIVNDNDPLYQFYRYWTRKEAIIKADGRGMHLPLNRFDVSRTPVRSDRDVWFLTEVNLHENYCCSVASEKNYDIPVEKQFCSFYQQVN